MFNGISSMDQQRCAKTVNWRRKMCQLGRGKQFEEFGRKCCKDVRSKLCVDEVASCGEAQIS